MPTLVASWIKHSVGTQLTSSPHPPPAPLSFRYPACFAIYFIPVQRKMRLDTISGSFTAKQGVQWHSLPCTQSMATEPCRPTPLHCRLKSLVVTATFAQQCQQCMYACFFFLVLLFTTVLLVCFFKTKKKVLFWALHRLLVSSAALPHIHASFMSSCLRAYTPWCVYFMR